MLMNHLPLEAYTDDVVGGACSALGNRPVRADGAKLEGEHPLWLLTFIGNTVMSKC